jgi:ribosomal-protein-alanine N-acetyltransferase
VREPRTNVLETERLILRHLAIDDLSPLARIYSDPDVRRFFPEGTLTYEETKEELEWIIEVYYGRYGFGLWATIDKGTGVFIGRCGLLPWTIVPGNTGGLALRHADEYPPGTDGTEVELAYLLDKSHWGKGLGTEAAQAIVDYGFEHLHLPRLICLFDPENRASGNVARKVGMTYENDVELDAELIPLFSISSERAEALRRAR